MTLRSSPAQLAVCLLLLAPPSSARATERPAEAQTAFTPGDLYLVTNALPGGLGPGIIRIDPSTGATSILADLPTASVWGTSTYEPIRDQLFFSIQTSIGGLRAIDADGTLYTPLPALNTPRPIAARGDGILYLWVSSAAARGFHYLDATDGLHDLLDEAGTARFDLSIMNGAPTEMIYDPTTNALICFAGSSTTVEPCLVTTGVSVVRIPLTPGGTQVAGPLQCLNVDVSTTSEDVVGSGLAPGSRILFVTDTNSNLREPRMQFLDPVTMTATPFASNGPYTGAAATNAGTWSSVRGMVVILDTLADSLRAYGQGGVGLGQTFAYPVSGAGAGEIAHLVEIRDPASTAVDDLGDGSRGLRLLDVMPNPMRSTTTVEFELAAEAPVSAGVFDLAGRKVHTLADGMRPAGAHRLTWRAGDQSGRRVAPGLYFLRLESRNQTVGRKIVVIW